MRTVFWVAVGAGATVAVIIQARRLSRRFAPSPVAQRVETRMRDVEHRALTATQSFRSTFAQARSSREAELTAALLAHGTPDPANTRTGRGLH